MGGGGQQQNLMAQGTRDDEYQNWYQDLMNDVQYGREGTRMILPLRGGEIGPQFDPKDVPIIPSPSGRLHFDPNYSPRDNLHYIAQGTGGRDSRGIDEQQLAMILSRLGYGGQGV